MLPRPNTSPSPHPLILRMLRGPRPRVTTIILACVGAGTLSSSLTAAAASIESPFDFPNRICVLDEGGTASTPFVRRTASGFEMWLSVNVNGSSQLFHSTSMTGVDWSPSTPELLPGPGWDSIHIHDAVVVSDGSSHRLWYTGYGGGQNEIGLATSTDGVTWSKHSGGPVLPVGSWDSRVVRVGSVIFDAAASEYRMWYTGGADWFHSLQVGYATSSDGVTWTRASAPVFSFGSAVEWNHNKITVTQLADGSFEMYFTCSEPGVYRATSLDGLNWLVDPNGPVLMPADEGWDSAEVGGPSVVRIAGVPFLWYDGSDGVDRQIGFSAAAPASGSCVNDLNGDGIVDGADLGLLLGGWGLCP